MKESKSWGFDKPKTKLHIISFRTDDKHYVMLDKLFSDLHIEPRNDTMTNKMVLLIEHASGLIQKLGQKTTEYEKQISTLKSQIYIYESEKKKLVYDAQKMVVANRMEQAEQAKQAKQAAQPKPEPSKSEPIPPKPEPKAEPRPALTKQLEPLRMGASEPIKTASPRPQMPDDKGLIACPDDVWVTKDDCEKCRTTNFKKYSNCYSERVKNPNGLIFKVSKPKPQ
jgi:hypothetical protein